MNRIWTEGDTDTLIDLKSSGMRYDEMERKTGWSRSVLRRHFNEQPNAVRQEVLRANKAARMERHRDKKKDPTLREAELYQGRRYEDVRLKG